LQHSGLDVGQFIGLRGDYDGETLQGCEWTLNCSKNIISVLFCMSHLTPRHLFFSPCSSFQTLVP
jgi:hypothetical protein